MVERADVVIVGGGIIGSAIAYELTRRCGRSVAVLERDRVGGQASIAFAGILAVPAEYGAPEPLRDLAQASIAIYPEVVDDLRARTGLDPQLRHTGALHLAVDEAEEAAARAALPGLQARDPACRWLDAAALREAEPAVGPGFRGALFAPGEWHVLSPLLVRAYARAAALAGAHIVEATEVRDFVVERGRVTALATTNGRVEAGTIVLAVGAWSGALGQRLGLDLPVGPLRGQIIRLAAWTSPVRHILYRGDSYIVGKADGTIAVGATEEEVSFDRRATGAGIAYLAAFATETVPALGEATFLDAWAGLRPLPADGLPLIGPAPGLENVVVATGHARNGVLWSPITARIVADLLAGTPPALTIAPFDPARFARS